MKFVSHLVLLLVGGAIGVWWGVHHPTQAANLAAHEQKVAAEAKIKILEQLHSSTPTTASAPNNTAPGDKVQQLLDQSHKELNDANQQLQN